MKTERIFIYFPKRLSEIKGEPGQLYWVPRSTKPRWKLWGWIVRTQTAFGETYYEPESALYDGRFPVQKSNDVVSSNI